ncbi:hypothetical protein OV203_49955 [Nannocystis sp. ILAH1]|uniref:hypothetical protein n=1 Tax=Nannocystis sp. ILAH1 TaxID=2996789 RepID=UPI0022715C87|nr:hypothetical protein [Nannocystis sp. ILAH1]MCY0995351.1 hypothetical protein [Nannocystis sp. ILAH1]
MSSTQAPVWAFHAEAIDGVADTHLPTGIHVRALPSARLGLPAAPLVVYRAVLDLAKFKDLVHDGGVTWIDSHGAPRTVPFDVTPDNPVYGYFPAPEVFWAELLAEPGDKLDPPKEPPFKDIGELAKGGFKNEEELEKFTDTLGPILAEQQSPAGVLRFEALTSTGVGAAPILSRSTERYALAAWTIQQVRVVGKGTVKGIRWLDSAALKKAQLSEQLWQVWSLPVKPKARYHPTGNAESEAKDRVHRGGATRQPMYVAHTAMTPGTAPSAIPDDAFTRVDQVSGEIDRWLDLVLNDTSVETWQVTDQQDVDGKDGNIRVPVEPFILAGAVDPDVGHWLGFGDVDLKPPAGVGSLVFYRVRGVWRWRAKQWNSAQQQSFAAAVRSDSKAVEASFPELKEFGLVPTEKGQFVDLHATAVAFVGTPPELPPAMTFDSAEDRGWLAEPPPPDVRRALRLLASEFRPHAVAALAATDVRGDRTLHAYPKHGRITIGEPLPPGLPLPLVVSRPIDQGAPGEGRFEERDAPEGAVFYRLAEGDWFGRWSPWRTLLAPAKPRTPPMRPVIEIYPQPPTVGSPVQDGLLHCTITVRIPIPRTSELPPGGARLARLDLVETFEGSPTTTVSYLLASPAPATIESLPPAPDMLLVVRDGPDLPRCGSKKVTYTARWIDELGLVSPDALPAQRTIVDPRPPPPPPVITELRWTARPDVEGHARVDLDFGSTIGTRYRVFVSNETLLLKALEQDGHHAARAEILAAEPGAPRAEKFKDHKALFGWDHFEGLTRQPIVAAATTTRFVHRVSGSLEVLTIYRVLGEGPSGALSEMSEADLVPFAVPNLGPPTRPQVSLVNAGLDPTTDGVKLRVKVPRSKAVPKAWRLRRTSTPTRESLAMQVVDAGPVSGAQVDGEGTSFDILAATPLKAWRVYKFAVEVQADDPPGAPTVGVILPGEWSEASAPATVSVIPPNPPAAAAAIAVQNVPGALQITLSHPNADSLYGSPMGMHRFELWRIEPGQRPARREVTFTRGAADTWVGSDPGEAPAGTYVTVSIIDPAGRRSDATPSNQI